jgi:ubiquinone/menaquinone biosynthesis C-methylase UbiE
MNDQAARFVGSIPENYDRGLGPVLFAGWAEDVARLVAGLNPASVLELAAGTGIVTRKLRDELADDCKLVATDLNTPMLAIAKTKFQKDELVRFEQADATNLQYTDASFDFVICQFGVMFFPDKKRSHTEVLRVLKPGGTYLFTLWDSMEANPFARLIHETIAGFFPENPPEFYKVPYGYNDADEVRDLVISAGFSEVIVERPAINSTIASVRDFAEGLVFGNPLYQEVVARGGKPVEVCKALEDTIRHDMGSELLLKILRIQARKG